MSKGAESHRQPADKKDDDFCLADAVVKLTDEQLEQLAEDDAQARGTADVPKVAKVAVRR